jgi:uncharacterized lipoprotein YmbA
MKIRTLMTATTVALVLAACGGGGGDPVATVTDVVPDEASTSATGMAQWLEQVALTAPEDKEPLDVARFSPPRPEDTDPEALK